MNCTRGLSERHFWIDSLCIDVVQDFAKDWAMEASKKVTTIYANG
jgi:hypothetical protein